MYMLFQCFGPEAAMSSISDFDRAGYIFLRESATMVCINLNKYVIKNKYLSLFLFRIIFKITRTL